MEANMKTIKEFTFQINAPEGYYILEDDSILTQGDMFSKYPFKKWEYCYNSLFTMKPNNFPNIAFSRKIPVIKTKSAFQLIQEQFIGKKCILSDNQQYTIDDVYKKTSDNGYLQIFCDVRLDQKRFSGFSLTNLNIVE
jgi:hypothetical protein